MPALFKGSLEHIFRPGFAMNTRREGSRKWLLAGRSARIVVIMGMPVLRYLADEKQRARWIEDLRRRGGRGD
jgi:putative NADPH-quinone reductase